MAESSEGKKRRSPRAGLEGWETLGIAIASAAIAQPFGFPLARIVTLRQAQAELAAHVEYTGVLDALRRIGTEQGLRAYWRGMGAQFAGKAVGLGVGFLAFDEIQRQARSYVHV